MPQAPDDLLTELGLQPDSLIINVYALAWSTIPAASIQSLHVPNCSGAGFTTGATTTGSITTGAMTTGATFSTIGSGFIGLLIVTELGKGGFANGSGIETNMILIIVMIICLIYYILAYLNLKVNPIFHNVGLGLWISIHLSFWNPVLDCALDSPHKGYPAYMPSFYHEHGRCCDRD